MGSKGLGWVCDTLGGQGIACDKDIPTACKSDFFGKADWAFSMYYELNKGASVKDEDICNFEGAGVISAEPGRPDCVLMSVPAPPTPPPSAGDGDGAAGDGAGD